MAAATLSADEARRLQLWSLGMVGAPDRRGGVPAVLRQLRAVQLDTISVLARNHELVAYARLGAVGRSTVEAAYWADPPVAFEYWSHVASILPLEDWPWHALRRRRWRRVHEEWDLADPGDRARREVLARLAEGPATATDLGGAKQGGPWWDWSDAKRAVEQLLGAGVVVCTRRQGWKRVYDLAERAVPAELRAVEPSDDECHAWMVAVAARALGVGTLGDLRDWFRLKVAPMPAAIEAAGLVPVTVAGWGEPAWAHPSSLAALSEGRVRGRHRTTLLSPFDPVVWDRARAERVFGFTHRLEAYTPKPKRVHGYFAMPVLAGGRIVGRVDPARRGRTLVAQQVGLLGRRPERNVPAVAAAIVEAASWVGSEAVAVERVDPHDCRPALVAEVAALAG